MPPWDQGIPKTVLRSRRTERRSRLSLMARVNERRCADPYCSSAVSNSFELSMPTPDLVFHITSLLRSRVLSRRSELTTTAQHSYPFAYDAWLACQRAFRVWPDQRACADADGPPNDQRKPVDTVGGLFVSASSPAVQERIQAHLGPEASFTWKWSGLESSLRPLRELLRSPIDVVGSDIDLLNR